MPATFDGNQEIRLACKIDRVLHIGFALALHDQRGIFVDGRIQYAARFLVGLVSGQQQIAANALAEFSYCGLLQRNLSAVTGNGIDVGTNATCTAENCRQTPGRRK